MTTSEPAPSGGSQGSGGDRPAGRPSEAQALIFGERPTRSGVLEVAHLERALGVHYQKIGRLDEAEPLLRRAVDAMEAALGPESADVAAASHQLAVLMASNGQVAEAEGWYRRALAIRRRVLGDGHPAVAATLHNLAVLCESLGRSEEAHQLWAEAGASFTRNTGGATKHDDPES
ncbi:MAG: tetratricopeptide repeat protein [Actinomycetota bacterium]|jgi:tetratricopeptide (TPR) repeat protein